MHQNAETEKPAKLVDGQSLVEAVRLAMVIRPETFAMPEVARYMGLHPQTAREWVRKGILPPPIIKVGRTVRWSRAQLEKVLAEGVQA